MALLNSFSEKIPTHLSILAFFFYIRKRKKADYEIRVEAYENLTAAKIKDILPLVLYIISSEILTQTLIASGILFLYYMYIYSKDNQVLLMNPLLIISGLNVLKVTDFHGNRYLFWNASC